MDNNSEITDGLWCPPVELTPVQWSRPSDYSGDESLSLDKVLVLVRNQSAESVNGVYLAEGESAETLWMNTTTDLK